MIIRKSTEKDIPNMVKIYEQSRKAMKDMGIDQWQGETPNADTAIQDIKNDYSYVCELDGEIIATAVIYVGNEPTYDKIYDGKWLTELNEYGVIHRLAVSPNNKKSGVAIKLMDYAADISIKNGVSLRCDTHIDNLPMRGAMEKFGFVLCGTIVIDDGTQRVAYEKPLLSL